MNARLFNMAWRNLWRNPRRTWVLVTVFALGLFTMLMLQSFLHGWLKSTLETTQRNFSDPIQVHHPLYLNNPQIDHAFALPEQLTDLLTLQYMTSVRIKVPAMIQSEYETQPVTLWGIDSSNERRLSFIQRATQQGEPIGKQPGVVIGQKLAEHLQTEIGRRIVIMTQHYDGGLAEIGLTVQGIYQHPDPRIEQGFIFIPYAVGAKWLGLGDKIHELAIWPRLDPISQQHQLNQLAQSWQTQFEDLSIQSLWQRQPVLLATIELSNQMIWIWLGFVLLLMMLGMLNTLIMSIYERQAELHLLFSLGMNPWRLRRLLLFELIWILLLSSLIALTSMMVVVLLAEGGIELQRFASGAAQFGMGSKLYLEWQPQAMWQLALVTLSVTLLTAAWPIWRATRFVKNQRLKKRPQRKPT
jgi:ABC-type lipoprotein release transport system permease subunit